MRIQHIFYKGQSYCHEAFQRIRVPCPENISQGDLRSAQRKYSHHGHQSLLLWMVCRLVQGVYQIL